MSLEELKLLREDLIHIPEDYETYFGDNVSFYFKYLSLKNKNKKQNLKNLPIMKKMRLRQKFLISSKAKVQIQGKICMKY